MSLIANIAARDRFTQLLGGFGKALNTGPLTAAQASDALFGIAYKQPGMATLDDCKRILDRLHKERGMSEVNAALSRFGVWKIGDLFAGMCQDFFNYCHAVLTYGACPFYGWDLDGIPLQVRDRWLFWHPESESLFEHRARVTVEEIERFFNQGVEDVTGQPEWEKRYAEQSSAEEEL